MAPKSDCKWCEATPIWLITASFSGHNFHNQSFWVHTRIILPLVKCTNTLFCQISVGYHSELCVDVAFYRHNHFYQLGYIIFFGGHANYLYYLGLGVTLSKKVIATHYSK